MQKEIYCKKLVYVIAEDGKFKICSVGWWGEPGKLMVHNHSERQQAGDSDFPAFFL